MRYQALACDYDGTLAHHGVIDADTAAALAELRRSGRKVILVTGRELDDLGRTFPGFEGCFDQVVAENGALLYRPQSREVRLLAEAPPPAFVEALRARIPGHVSAGRAIVATWQPHESVVLEVIAEMGLDLQVIFNKGAVMVLPSGINKAVGLAAALDELGLSPHNAVGVGDAENDLPFLSACECGVAVANALPSLKDRVDVVTVGDHGVGVRELCRALVDNDLAGLTPRLSRHRISIGTRPSGEDVTMEPYRAGLLVAGASGGGKSTLTTALLERLADAGYQYCLIDPEGDHHELPSAVVIGNADRAPTFEEILNLLAKPTASVIVNLLGMRLADRPAFFQELLPRLLAMRGAVGRPHWIVLDETHHLAPADNPLTGLALPRRPHGLMYITVHPEHVSRTLLQTIDGALTVGPTASDALCELTRALGLPAPPKTDAPEPGEALTWSREAPTEVGRMRANQARTERRRHVRKYAHGALDPDKSFYFRGPDERLNLRAHNLELFLQLGEGVDDDTWLHHLRAGDYSRWFRDAIKDEDLAKAAEAIESDEDLSAALSRERVRAAVEARYTAAA